MVASVAPDFGLVLRDLTLSRVTLFGETVKVSAPLIMLSFLLFNAGFGIKTNELVGLRNKPLMPAAGLIANILTPMFVIAIIASFAPLWHNPDELQSILVGLALVASMPIAGSSTAWAQNANGNMALSVGLVILSTILSPIVTPLGLQAVSLVTTGDYSEDLQELAQTGTKAFLFLSVIIPVMLGITARYMLKELRATRIRSYLKLSNSAVLIVLIYSNAAISLPKAISQPDWDFLALILFVTISLCLIMFLSGWLISIAVKASLDEKISLLFALGMNNNGTGLVLAGMALADHPNVLLPIIFYNLVQHLTAGFVDFAIQRK